MTFTKTDIVFSTTTKFVSTSNRQGHPRVGTLVPGDRPRPRPRLAPEVVSALIGAWF